MSRLPTRSESFKIRLSIEELADYNARAHALGMDVSSWVRMKCLDVDALGEDPGIPSTGQEMRQESFKSRKTGPVKSSTRTAMCEHRRRPDQYCARCD